MIPCEMCGEDTELPISEIRDWCDCKVEECLEATENALEYNQERVDSIEEDIWTGLPVDKATYRKGAAWCRLQARQEQLQKRYRQFLDEACRRGLR